MFKRLLWCVVFGATMVVVLFNHFSFHVRYNNACGDTVFFLQGIGIALSQRISPRFKHIKTAVSGPLPIERALKSDILTILVVYQLSMSNY